MSEGRHSFSGALVSESGDYRADGDSGFQEIFTALEPSIVSHVPGTHEGRRYDTVSCRGGVGEKTSWE